MASPSDRRFSDSHEWFHVDGNIVTIGITRYAADELSDLTYIQMKPLGTRIAAGGTVGEVESVKTTSDVYSAVGGEIVDVNTKASDDPAIVNSDSFGAGWLVKIRSNDLAPLDRLMDQRTYDAKHPVS